MQTIMSVSEGAEEEEDSNSGNQCDGEIFEGELFEADGIDPMESLNITDRHRFQQLQERSQPARACSSSDREEGEEIGDILRDLVHRSE